MAAKQRAKFYEVTAPPHLLASPRPVEFYFALDFRI